jgi:hypothetical protein
MMMMMMILFNFSGYVDKNEDGIISEEEINEVARFLPKQ